MTPEQDPLVAAAEAVADGNGVDWARHQERASHDDAAALRELRIIDAIARLHRQQIAKLPSADQSVSDVTGRAVESATIPNTASPWGPLLLLEKLGSGAFADVFRAWDRRLDREVALKVLHHRPRPGVAASIVREGQLLARVSHPNVMAVYGAEEVDGQVGIWGELLRGRTLARIVAEDGALGSEEALVCSTALCRALSAAHRAGLLHRDVKAQNVMREKGGRIVLMDFGLGREVDSAPERGSLDLAGTPLYMAPELFTGGRASVQSDVYSLGVLMFFLVTGTFPVLGRSLDEIASAHASGRRQRLQDLRQDLSEAFIHVVERALDPDPARRFESWGEMQAALTKVAYPGQPVVRAASGFRLLTSPIGLAAVAAALIVGAVSALVWLSRVAPVPPPRSIVFSITPARFTRFLDSSWNTAAISPNGDYVAVVAMDERTRQRHLWLHSLRSSTITLVPQSERAVAPLFWSPDSRELAFFGPEGLRRISVGGVRADTVAAAGEPRGGTWNQRGIVLFAPDPRSGLFRISTTGETPKPTLVMAPDVKRGELGYIWPQFLPDGERFIYFVLSNDDSVRGIHLSSLSGGERTRLVASDASGIVDGDMLLFVRDSNLVVQEFDLSQRRAVGPAAVLIEGVGTSFDYRSVVTASDDGTLVYSPRETTRLTRYDLSGLRLGVIDVPAGRYRSPALSRDGRYLAIQQYRDTLSRILVFDLQRGGIVTTLTGGSGASRTHSPDVQFPAWGPANQLAYASSDFGWLDIYVTGIGTPDPPRLLLRSPTHKMPSDWSPDGRLITYTELTPSGAYRLHLLSIETGEIRSALAGHALQDGSGRFSPDGTRLAYVASDSGPPEVWIRPIDASPASKVSVAGGLDPVWLSQPDLSFLDLSGRLMIGRLRNGGFAAPVPAFPTLVITPGASRNNYVWNRTTRELIINENVEDALEPRVLVMTHWRARLAAAPVR